MGTSLAIVGLNAAVGVTEYVSQGGALPKAGFAFGASGVLGGFADVCSFTSCPAS